MVVSDTHAVYSLVNGHYPRCVWYLCLLSGCDFLSGVLSRWNIVLVRTFCGTGLRQRAFAATVISDASFQGYALGHVCTLLGTLSVT